MDPTEVFDTYWRFAAKRQEIYFRRLTEPIGPWTNDPILQSYRFTNAYRAADRVSQFLISNVQYGEERSQAPDDVFFRTLLFKIFNRIETWDAIERLVGPVDYQNIDLNKVSEALSELMRKGEPVYSAAYIMPSPNLGHKRKHDNHLALIQMMMDDRLAGNLRQKPSLAEVYEGLLRYPSLGPFLAFQLTIDLNYSSLIDFPEESFVIAGPGAIDGISKCFSDAHEYRAEELIMSVCDMQAEAFTDLQIEFRDLFGRRLMPIDCQNLFCEISKYARVAHPNRPGSSGRTRIKQHYRETGKPLSTPFFPPKWGIDDPVNTRPGVQEKCLKSPDGELRLLNAV